MNLRILRHAVPFVALLAPPLHAAVHCVDSPATFKSAIDIAESNGEDDVIRLVGGTYAASPPFHFQSTEAHAITFSGGYNIGCSGVGDEPTAIDGQNLHRGLFVLNPAGDVVVENLTFARGLSTNNRGGGLHVTSTDGDIRLDRSVFLANRADDFGGAATMSTANGNITVRNNLAFANSSANIGAFELLQNQGEGRVTGNTIVANQSEGDFLPGGLWIGGDSHWVVANNIIWNNLQESPGPFQSDFRSNATTHVRYSNDIGVVYADTVAIDVVGELSVDPQFAGCGFLCIGFELERSSPLVDAGDDAPAGGMTTTDLAGKPRTIGPHVDIGAYENDLLFADGFD